MVKDDYRVVARCPRRFAVIVDFVNRDPIESEGIRLSEVAGQDWVGQVCDGTFPE
jgi:hypothetical protein